MSSTTKTAKVHPEPPPTAHSSTAEGLSSHFIITERSKTVESSSIGTTRTASTGTTIGSQTSSTTQTAATTIPNVSPPISSTKASTSSSPTAVSPTNTLSPPSTTTMATEITTTTTETVEPSTNSPTTTFPSLRSPFPTTVPITTTASLTTTRAPISPTTSPTTTTTRPLPPWSPSPSMPTTTPSIPTPPTRTTSLSTHPPPFTLSTAKPERPTTTAYTTHYVTTVFVITISTVVPRTTVISGSRTTVYLIHTSTAVVTTVIPDPSQPPPPPSLPSSTILDGQRSGDGLQTWQSVLILLGGLLIIVTVVILLFLRWYRKRQRDRAIREFLVSSGAIFEDGGEGVIAQEFEVSRQSTGKKNSSVTATHGVFSRQGSGDRVFSWESKSWSGYDPSSERIEYDPTGPYDTHGRKSVNSSEESVPEVAIRMGERGEARFVSGSDESTTKVRRDARDSVNQPRSRFYCPWTGCQGGGRRSGGATSTATPTRSVSVQVGAGRSARGRVGVPQLRLRNPDSGSPVPGKPERNIHRHPHHHQRQQQFQASAGDSRQDPHGGVVGDGYYDDYSIWRGSIQDFTGRGQDPHRLFPKPPPIITRQIQLQSQLQTPMAPRPSFSTASWSVYSPYESFPSSPTTASAEVSNCQTVHSLSPTTATPTRSQSHNRHVLSERGATPAGNRYSQYHYQQQQQQRMQQQQHNDTQKSWHGPHTATFRPGDASGSGSGNGTNSDHHPMPIPIFLVPDQSEIFSKIELFRKNPQGQQQLSRPQQDSSQHEQHDECLIQQEGPHQRGSYSSSFFSSNVTMKGTPQSSSILEVQEDIRDQVL